MNKTWLAVIGVFGVGLLLVVILLSMGVGFHNKEVKLRNLITAKQTDNKNEMDAMWKIIDQNAQVTVMQKNALMEIFNSYAAGRTPAGGSGSLALWVKEAVPNVDQKTYTVLMNTITAQRDGFKFRQKELMDFKREHDNLIDTFPNVIFATILGRHKIDVVIVTSDRTENAFKTGRDNDTTLPGMTPSPKPAAER